MNQTWNFQRDGEGGGGKTKKPSVGGAWIFSGTTHSLDTFRVQTHQKKIKTKSFVSRSQSYVPFMKSFWEFPHFPIVYYITFKSGT